MQCFYPFTLYALFALFFFVYLNKDAPISVSWILVFSGLVIIHVFLAFVCLCVCFSFFLWCWHVAGSRAHLIPIVTCDVILVFWEVSLRLCYMLNRCSLVCLLLPVQPPAFLVYLDFFFYSNALSQSSKLLIAIVLCFPQVC